MGILRRRARRGGVLGTAVIGGAAYAAGKSRGAKGGQQTQTQDEQPEMKTGSNTLGDDQMNELDKLGKLHENGTLTDEEFSAAKSKILNT